MKSVCIYCSSSAKIQASYFTATADVARFMAEDDIQIVCGGGAQGLMGQLADTTRQHNGQIVGILPEFMIEVEWDHKDLDELVVVETMYERKMMMLDRSEGVLMLPGGTGTFEEFFEAVTLKRLGRIQHPIVILNVDGYFDPLLEMLHRSINENFMHDKHRDMWQVVQKAHEVIPALKNGGDWGPNALDYAVVR